MTALFHLKVFHLLHHLLVNCVGERRNRQLNGLAFETRVLLVMIVCKSIFQPVLHQMRRN